MVIPVALASDLTPLVNLLFSTLVAIVALWAWRKTKKDAPLYIAGAFLLFGLSHLASFFGVGDSVLVLVVRIIGYVLVIGMLYRWYARGG